MQPLPAADGKVRFEQEIQDAQNEIKAKFANRIYFCLIGAVLLR